MSAGGEPADDAPSDKLAAFWVQMSDELAEAANWIQKIVRAIHEACPNHPVLQDLEKVGNGVFEDDHSNLWDLPHFQPIPGLFFRFRRGSDTAYMWLFDGGTWISPWHPLRPRRRQPGRTEHRVAGIRDALEAVNTPRRPTRRWWRLWKAEN